MDQRYELSFRPADEIERREFEGVLHQFVELVSSEPDDDAGAVFARYDTPLGRWHLSFETRSAMQRFRRYWAEHAATIDEGALRDHDGRTAV